MFGLFRKKDVPLSAPISQSNEVDEFHEMTAPAFAFLTLVNQRFPQREQLRDRSHLNAPYDDISLALARLFIVRDDLRPDVRELMMRLATFHDLPEDIRHLAVPLTFPPTTDGQRQMNDVVLRERARFWNIMDGLERDHPGGPTAAQKGEIGLLITTADRGWRPQSSLDVLDTNGNVADA